VIELQTAQHLNHIKPQLSKAAAIFIAGIHFGFRNNQLLNHDSVAALRRQMQRCVASAGHNGRLLGKGWAQWCLLKMPKSRESEKTHSKTKPYFVVQGPFHMTTHNI
jgi:hypothetical protein